MKKSLSIIALCFTLSIAHAQSPSAPETSKSSSKNTRSVKISINKNLKLDLKIDNEQFDMKIAFPKKYIKNFRKVFLANFRNSGENYIWNGNAASTKTKIRGNKIKVHFLKEEITNIEMNKIKEFSKEILDELDWDAETLGLWESSGACSNSNLYMQQ